MSTSGPCWRVPRGERDTDADAALGFPGGLHLTKVCNKDSPFAAVHYDVPIDRSNYEPSPLLQVSQSRLDNFHIDA